MSEKNSKIVEFFRKIGSAVLSLPKAPNKLNKTYQKLREKRTKEPERNIPNRLQGFFKNREAGWPEYVMLKAQISIILLFIFTVVSVLTEGPWLIFGPILLILSVYTAVLSHNQLKIAFGKDYPAYRAFVGICIGIAWGANFLLRYFPPVSEGILIESTLPIMLVITGAIFAFIIFRIKYGRSHTYGIVLESKEDKAKVKVRYDLRSNAKQGVYYVESFVPVEKDDMVKINGPVNAWVARIRNRGSH